jgi:hypothetical protein
MKQKTFGITLNNILSKIYSKLLVDRLIIINNINRNIPGIVNIDDIQVFLLLFGDDAVVFTHDPNSFQPILNDIEHYCNMWNLILNVSKTKVMIFENGRHTSYEFFLYNT